MNDDVSDSRQPIGGRDGTGRDGSGASGPEVPGTQQDIAQCEAPDPAMLSWCLGEIAESFSHCEAQLDACLQTPDAAPEALALARAALHQVHGALAIVQVRGVPVFIRAAENVLQGLIDAAGQSRLDETLRSAFARAFAAITEYLDGLLHGGVEQPLFLFPWYEALQQAAGIEYVHPADLYLIPKRALAAAGAGAGAGASVHEDGADDLAAARKTFEQGLLAVLRERTGTPGIAALHAAVVRISASRIGRADPVFWNVALAWFEALRDEALVLDVHGKRLLARMNLHLRAAIAAGAEGPESLLRELLFALATIHEPAGPPAGSSPGLLGQVRQAFGLAGSVPLDFAIPRFAAIDQGMLRSAQGAIGRAKDAWERMVAQDGSAHADLARAIDRLREPVSKLGLSGVHALVEACARRARFCAQAKSLPQESLAIGFASTLLFLEQIFASGPIARHESDARALELAHWLLPDDCADDACDVREIGPMPPWLHEFVQSSQQHLAMSGFVAGVREDLDRVEQVLDGFFRDSSQRGELASVAGRLRTIAGVLEIPGHAEAAAAARHVAGQIDGFAAAPEPPSVEATREVADNIGALGFFVDGLLQGGQRAVRFVFDPLHGRFRASFENSGDEAAAAVPMRWSGPLDGALSPLARHVRQAMQLVDACERRPGDADARQALRRALVRIRDDAHFAGDTESMLRASEAIACLSDLHGPIPAQVLADVRQRVARLVTEVLPAAGDEPCGGAADGADVDDVDAEADDAELIAIFLGEAAETLADIAEAGAAGRADAGTRAASGSGTIDTEALTRIRRGFHTLKGSSRMVGLDSIGEAAWAMEELLNRHLAGEAARSGADAAAADHDLAGLVDAVSAFFRQWVDTLQDDTSAPIDPAPVLAAIDAFAAAGSEPSGQVLSETRLREDGSPEIESPEVESSEVESSEIESPEIESSEIESSEIGEQEIGEQEIDAFVCIGGRSIERRLYEIFLTEADDLLATLTADLDEWRRHPRQGVSVDSQRAMHSLRGGAALVQLEEVHAIADALERYLTQSRTRIAPVMPSERDDYGYVLERVRALLHQFAAGTAPGAEPQALARARALAAGVQPASTGTAASTEEPLFGEASASEPSASEPSAGEPSAAGSFESGAAPAVEPDIRSASTDDPDAHGAHGARPFEDLDPDLLPVFIEEAVDLLPRIGTNLRAWQARLEDRAPVQSLMRDLHTIKGSARMAGAMTLGQRLHEMETRVETAGALSRVPEVLIDELLAEYDLVAEMFESLRDASAPSSRMPADAAGLRRADPAYGSSASMPADVAPAAGSGPGAASPVHEQPVAGVPEEDAAPAPGQVAVEPGAVRRIPGPPASDTAAASLPRRADGAPLVRVRADLLEHSVNESGEISIARARIDTELGGLRQSLQDLTENVARLRSQLREVEIQAESRIQARFTQHRDADGGSGSAFDPLEFDRYTRFQELTRMLAESVDDVATVQANAMRSLDAVSQDTGRQSQLLRDLQQNLMRMRMVRFSTISDRLYRVVRQAAKELDKRVALDVLGAATEIDRGVLERMVGPVEHLLRNAVTHGIESPGAREAAGKTVAGEIRIEVRQEGNEVVLSIRDDGRGLDYERILVCARERGLLAPDAQPSQDELAELIFRPGFSTAPDVSELSGRGVGADVVRAEVHSLGGRIEIESQPGAGTGFIVHLPLTLSIAQVVIVSVGETRYAVPSSGIEQVLQLTAAQLARAWEDGSIEWRGAGVPLHHLGMMVGPGDCRPRVQHLSPVVIVRSGGLRLAVHVDSVSGNREVVVKSVGAQAARVPGIAGATVLGDGEIVLLLNIARVAQQILGDLWLGRPGGAGPELAPVPLAVMIVDDSLTVRKVTQRLLAREGYDVMLARDGVDAMRQLQDRRPDVMLVDIEMPRMDGFDLTRNVRADERLRDVPIIMITSRTADKHRSHALSLGVNVFLGKPYRDDELLGHIASFVADRAPRAWLP